MTTTCAILASDFSHSTTDVLRTRWTMGKMRHLVAALDGAPVAITVDKMSGHTIVGAVLVAVRETGDSNPGARVVVDSPLSDGTMQRTNYRLDQIGEAIIPLGRTGSTDAKWTAIRSYADEGSAAIRISQAAHGEAEGRAWGAWTATPGLYNVSVTYDPHMGNDFYADKRGTRGHWTVALSALEAAAVTA